MNKLLNAQEISHILNVSLPYAYSLMRRGEIPTVRMGRSVRVREQDLNKYIIKNLTSKDTDNQGNFMTLYDFSGIRPIHPPGHRLTNWPTSVHPLKRPTSVQVFHN